MEGFIEKILTNPWVIISFMVFFLSIARISILIGYELLKGAVYTLSIVTFPVFENVVRVIFNYLLLPIEICRYLYRKIIFILSRGRSEYDLLDFRTILILSQTTSDPWLRIKINELLAGKERLSLFEAEEIKHVVVDHAERFYKEFRVTLPMKEDVNIGDIVRMEKDVFLKYRPYYKKS